MRKMFEPQLPLLQRWIDKPHALEYKLMSQVLDDACDAVQAVYACLMRQGQRADRGRATLTAEQVLRILVVKQLENLSYEQLEFALADSSTFRTFCRLPQGLTPTKSVLHRCLKGLDEACLQLVHQAVLSVGLNDGIESGDRMRADCTCTETNIHAPFDSSLLWDSCRVLTRLTHRARMVGGVTLPFTDHSRKAKHHALAIRNAKTQEQRTSLYIELLALTRQAIDEARRMAAALLEFPPAEPSAKWEARQVVEQMDHYVPLAQKVIDQTHRRVNLGQTVAANDKVVSIFPILTTIVRKYAKFQNSGWRRRYNSARRDLPRLDARSQVPKLHEMTEPQSTKYLSLLCSQLRGNIRYRLVSFRRHHVQMTGAKLFEYRRCRHCLVPSTHATLKRALEQQR